MAALIFIVMLSVSSLTLGQGANLDNEATVSEKALDIPPAMYNTTTAEESMPAEPCPSGDTVVVAAECLEQTEPVAAAEPDPTPAETKAVVLPPPVADTTENKPAAVPATAAGQNTTPSPAETAAEGSVSRARPATDVQKYPKVSPRNGIYGQFYYRELGGGRIEIDPHWVEENIVTVTLPGVNRTVQIHKKAKDSFMKAFTLIANGTVNIDGQEITLLSLINTFDGTWVPRHINWDPSQGLSNHSWGAAVDINASDHFRYVNPYTEPHDPNLILWWKAFQPAGFYWGNSFSDAMHYELY